MSSYGHGYVELDRRSENVAPFDSRYSAANLISVSDHIPVEIKSGMFLEIMWSKSVRLVMLQDAFLNATTPLSKTKSAEEMSKGVIIKSISSASQRSCTVL